MRRDHGDRRAVLSDIAGALGRERHSLAQFPDLAWQQIHNRALAHHPCEATVALLEGWERSPSRSATPWFRQVWAPYDAAETVLQAHTDWVLAVAVDAAGERVLTGGRDGSLRLWQAATGRLLATLDTRGAWVYDCVFFGGDRRALSCGGDRMAWVWDLEAREPEHAFEHPDEVRGCAVDESRGLFATACYDGGVRVGSLSDRHLVFGVRAHVDRAHTVAFARDGGLVVSGGRDGFLCVTDVSTGAVVGRAAGGSSCYKVAAFPDGERFAAAHASGDVSVWAVDGPLELARAHAHSGETLGCAVSPEGSLVASGGSDARVAIWSAADLSPVARLSGHGDAVFACAFLAAERIVTGSVDTSARIMCIERGGDGQAAPLTQPLFLGGISSVAAEPTGTVLAAGGSGRVGRVDPVRGRVLAEVGVEAGRGPSRLAPVGDASGPIALGCPNGEIHLLDRESLKIVASAPSHAGVVASCAWGPDGRELLTAGWDGSVLVSRRVFGGGLLPRASVSFAPAQVACASWLPDGRVLVGGGNGLLAIWDPATGDHDGVTVGDSTPISATVVLQDGEAVAVLADGRAVSWADACAGREAATVCRRPAALPGQEADAWGVWCAGRFGPRAIAVGATGVVTIWDVATKRVRARVPMSGAVYSVCAVESPELTLLCAGSTSGHLSVFESCGVIERGDGDSSRDDAAAR